MNERLIPHWNLDSIFSPLNPPEYDQGLKEFSIGMEKLENLLKTSGQFNFSFWLKGYIEEEDRVKSLFQTLNAYSYITYSVDTSNQQFLNNISKIEELSLRLKKIDSDFSAILVKNSKKIDDFFQRFPQLSERRFLLEEKLLLSKHKLSPKEENLSGILQQTGGNAWSRLQEQIISTIHDDTGKTFNELRNDAFSAEPSVRRESYLKELSLLEANSVALSACLNNLKGETINLNKKRKWKTPLDRALFSNRINKKTLQTMLKAVEKSLPLFRKYFQAKAKYLRANNLTVCSTLDSRGNLEKGLAFYDLFAPLSKNDSSQEGILSKDWSFKEAEEYITARFSAFSDDMGTFCKKVFAENWIDGEIRNGKVGGAYDEDFPLTHESRILTNFSGKFSDVITLAHEIGHAYHFSCLKGKQPCFFSYPMTLAETASTFAETVIKQDLLKKASDEEKLQILEMDLQDVSQVLVDILCRYYFEKAVFQERENSELTSEDFCRIMLDCQEKTYGNGLNSIRHPYMWAVKSHYYSTDLDFYNFPYAFGQLFASALYSKFQQEGKNFAVRYREILSKTGSMSCEDLCMEAGFDISSPDFWKDGMEMYKKEIEEFILLSKGKSSSVTVKKGSTPKTVFESSPAKKGGLLKLAENYKKQH